MKSWEDMEDIWYPGKMEDAQTTGGVFINCFGQKKKML